MLTKIINLLLFHMNGSMLKNIEGFWYFWRKSMGHGAWGNKKCLKFEMPEMPQIKAES
jgi:hypothetical protein